MGNYSLEINSFMDIFTLSNQLSNGILSSMLIFAFFIVFFSFAKRTTTLAFAGAYSLLATTVFSLLLTLVDLVPITFVWTLGILTVAVIMYIFMRKGGE